MTTQTQEKTDRIAIEPTLVAEDGGPVDLKVCPGSDIWDGTVLAEDRLTGQGYWVCVHCRAIVRPARFGRA